ncbi:hypothetical protein [Mycoplasma parvum]|uniref:Uncharacterized protein n=1 Tax=Mycoplasma parvum str. Indiana TaxID=1403316 RepID=U5NFU9_9MOLU|nr:hypothetical protein [Mycoplasma parvum]AGX89123.1 hypothetical protein PRV_01925 [Mycoplasma parvum str. Indiana]
MSWSDCWYTLKIFDTGDWFVIFLIVFSVISMTWVILEMIREKKKMSYKEFIEYLKDGSYIETGTKWTKDFIKKVKRGNWIKGWIR